ncbi:MAG: 16S rRNA (guanine(527)-N(7))-methyltransferase RsmG [Caulobacteraceae bacterium]
MQPDIEVAPFDAAAFATATNATALQMADLAKFRDLLEAGTQRMNLVGPSALRDFWLRHAFDSAQLLSAAPHAHTWADLGAGAGFPGVVLAIFLKGIDGAKVHLIESVAKRCGFLVEVVSALSLPAVVHRARAEDLSPTPRVEIVTARACAPLERLLGYAEPFMRAGASGLFLKGRTAEDEVTEAHKRWRFEVALTPSLSDPSGRIIRVERLLRV